MLRRIAFHLAGSLCGLAAALLAVPPAAAAPKLPVTIQVLSVSDLQGQLEPLSGAVGGAAYLKAFFDQERANNPNTLLLAAGQSFGASPPISEFFDEEPTVLAMNMMGFTADTLGNHNFDRGVAQLHALIDLADFDFVAANLDPVDRLLRRVKDFKTYHVGGVKVAVIGIVNEEAPTLVPPGSLGATVVTDAVAAANKAAKAARKKGARIVIVIVQKGIADPSAPAGPLADFAGALEGVDLVLGGHTDVQYQGTHGGALVVQNRFRGRTYARSLLTYDFESQAVTAKSATFITATNAVVTPDPGISALLASYDPQIPPILATVIATSSVSIPRSDVCGNSAGRTCESLVGDVVTDAMRATYGTDFAVTNSGGLRDALTCVSGDPSGFCPVYTPPPHQITRGEAQSVLPFGNVVATLSVNGAELKTMLENGVSSMPAVNGRFPQVSGLCFTYDIEAAVGSRVTSAVRQASDGACTGTPVDLTAGSTYTVAENDFMAAGGDGYPDFSGRVEFRDVMATVVSDYVAVASPLNPLNQGRIVCFDANPGSGANCPTILP